MFGTGIDFGVYVPVKNWLNFGSDLGHILDISAHK